MEKKGATKTSQKSSPAKSDDCAINCLGVTLGVILLIIGVVCSAYELPKNFVLVKIHERITINQESSSYGDWAVPKVPIHMTFYLFNVTNRDEILVGEKPVVEEIGPYVYRMYAPKFNVTFYPNSSVSYYSNYSIVFQPQLSKGDESDEVFHINFPLIAFEKTVRSTASISYFRIFNGMVERAGGSDLFPKHTVREVLFGYDDPISTMLQSFSVFLGPIEPRFGFFRNFNHSNGGLYLINTGLDGRTAHRIDKWNRRSDLQFWSSKWANMINGTAGSVLGTNLTPKDNPYFYFSQMCRSAKLEFVEKSRTRGIETLKFHLSSNFLSNSTVHPDNAGFCVPPGNCFDSGVLNVQSCKKSPIFLSFPHFYNAAEKYQKGVVGLKPDKNKHDSVFHVEPKSGAMLRGSRRLQINSPIQPTSQFRNLGRVRETMLPVLWLDLSAEFQEEGVRDLRFAVETTKYIWILSYIVIFVAFLVLLFYLYFVLKPCVPKRMRFYTQGTRTKNDETNSGKQSKAATEV